MIELGTSDSGSRQSVRVGERASVRLPETATTGYRWHQVDEGDEGAGGGLLTLVEDGSDGPRAPRGAGGERTFVFEAVRTGAATIRLEKSRAWESGAPVEQFTVTVDVQP